MCILFSPLGWSYLKKKVIENLYFLVTNVFSVSKTYFVVP